MIMLLCNHVQHTVESDTVLQVTKFLEKPKVEETESSKACPPLYIYSKSAVPLINQYVDEAEGKLALVDAPGSLGTNAHHARDILLLHLLLLLLHHSASASQSHCPNGACVQLLGSLHERRSALIACRADLTSGRLATTSKPTPTSRR